MRRASEKDARRMFFVLISLEVVVIGNVICLCVLLCIGAFWCMDGQGVTAILQSGIRNFFHAGWNGNIL